MKFFVCTCSNSAPGFQILCSERTTERNAYMSNAKRYFIISFISHTHTETNIFICMYVCMHTMYVLYM